MFFFFRGLQNVTVFNYKNVFYLNVEILYRIKLCTSTTTELFLKLVVSF